MLKKILLGVIVLILLYGALLLAERLTRQELTRVTNPQSGEAVSLMWQPHLLHGNGVCYLDLLNPQGRITDSAQIRVLESGFEALQQCGQVEFKGTDISVNSLRTGQPVQHFTVRDGHLTAAP